MTGNLAVPALVVLGIILAVLGIIVAGNINLTIIGLVTVFAGGLLQALTVRKAA